MKLVKNRYSCDLCSEVLHCKKNSACNFVDGY